MQQNTDSIVRHYNYLDLFFTQSQDAISVFDMENNVITCNPAFEKLYGWTLDECVGKPISFYPETEYAKVLERQKLLISGQALPNMQVTELRKDGSVFQAEINMTPIFNEDHEVVAVSHITHDITSRLEIETYKAEMERLETISTIAANVAHEVRNPMTAINGFIQMMNRDAKNPYAYFTEIMENEIGRINQIVTDFLVLAQPATKEPAVVSIREALDEILFELDAKFKEMHISCQVRMIADDFKVAGSKSSLQQVFHNLLKNSCEANARTIHVGLATADDQLEICIKDDGCGMDAATMQMLEQPFFSTKVDGTGLGILIAKKIIMDHKGTLRIESQQGAGTNVLIRLPLAKDTLY